MSTSKNSALDKGWIRVLLFFAVFLGVFVLANMAWQHVGTGTAPGVTSPYSNAILFAFSALIVVFLFRKLIDKKTLLSLGFQWQGTARNAVLGLLFPAVILGIGSLLLYANENIDYHDAFYPGPNLFVNIGLMALIAVAEESVFRGYILNNLLSSFNKWLALILSASLFAFVHSANPNVSLIALVNVFIAGVLIGLPYIYTKNLLFSICFHFSWNLLQGPVLGFGVSGLQLESVVKADISGNPLLTGGEFGFEGSVLQTLLFVIAIFVLWIYFESGKQANGSVGIQQ